MNKTLILIITALGLTGLGVGAGFWFANARMANTMPAVSATTNAATTERKPLYYHDPMVPQQKFDKPGKSPFMDMMLVPVYGDSNEADSGTVKINPRVAQNLGIRTAEVTEGSIDRKLQVVGTVAFDERAVVVVQARVNGYIEKLFVRAPLDSVAKGQPLAEIFAPDWIAAQEEYLALKKSANANDALRQAARQRLQVLGMSDATIAAIDADGKSRPRVTLVAPISGVVGELLVREGMTVQSGAMLFRLNGLSNVWVNADVPETQAAWLKPGSAIEADVPAYPGEIFKGRVTALLPEVNSTTRTLRARIEVANPGHRLAPGMFATIAAATTAKPATLLVPSEAVIQTGKRSVVIVAEAGADGKPQFAPADVEIGAESGGMTEIKTGLKKGMKVVLSGQFLIDSEASLKTTGARMGDAPPVADAATSAVVNTGEGKVEAINKDGVTLSHGPIKTLKMGAMTMTYKAPKNGVPSGIRVGQTVSFDLVLTPDGDMALTRIEQIPVPMAGGKK